MPSLGNKLYSFGALADVHLYKNGVTHDRFVKAVKFFTDEEKVSFTCISGDLTGQGTPQQFVDYIDIVEDAVGSCEGRAVIHDTTGNHDVEQGMLDRSYLQSYADGREPYASRELFYSFTHGNDVFIMFGMTGWPGKYSGYVLFSEESLQWLYDTS